MLSLESLIIYGNLTQPDPLLRLGEASSALTLFSLSNCALQHSTGTPSSIAWPDFFSQMPELESLSFGQMSLGPNGVTLPNDGFPALSSIILIECGLIGDIPELLLPNSSNFTATSFTMIIADNDGLAGTIPENLFNSFDLSGLSTLQISLSNNSLSGTLPGKLFNQSFTNLQSLVVDLSHNNFSGPMDPLFNSSSFTDGILLSVKIAMDDNAFSGNAVSWFNGVCSAVQYFEFTASNNDCAFNLLGNGFMSLLGVSSKLEVFKLDFNHNGLNGTLSTQFTVPEVSPKTWYIDFSYNSLSGDIGSTFLSSINWTSADTATFNFADNLFTGGMPSLFTAVPPQMTSLLVDFSSNLKMNGTLPSSFFEPFAASTTAPTPPQLSVAINISSTALHQELKLPDLTDNTQSVAISVFASNANFSSLTFAGSASKGLLYLDVSGNTYLTGKLPNSVFESSQLTTLKASSTLLAGTMPNIGALNPSSLTLLDLSNTPADFCSGMRTTWQSYSLLSCSLINTSAQKCSSNYPKICFLRCCKPETQPSPAFTCVDGIWTAIGSTLGNQTISIPSGTVQTSIIGNVSSTSVIIGVDSTLVIHGCAANLSSVTLELTPQELKQLGSSTTEQILLAINPNYNCSDLSGIDVSLHVKGDSCRKAKLKSSSSNGQLSAILSIDTSGCRTWWIILVSVLCAFIVILAIIFVLLVIFVRPVREFVRPYSKRTADADKTRLK